MGRPWRRYRPLSPSNSTFPLTYWDRLYTPFQSEPGAEPVRLIVRRVKPSPGSQLALFATYSYHAFITDRDGDTLELEADHRRHAETWNAIRDLKYGALPCQRSLAGGTGHGPQPGPLDGAHRSG